jgi:hypothetical protein
VLIVARPKARRPVERVSAAQKNKKLRKEAKERDAKLADKEKEIKLKDLIIMRMGKKASEDFSEEYKIAVNDIKKKAELRYLLEKTGETWKKSDNKNKLKERLLAPRRVEPMQQPRAPKPARVASLFDDEDDSQLLVQRDTSSRGRSLKRPARMRDE